MVRVLLFVCLSSGYFLFVCLFVAFAGTFSMY